MGAFQTFIFLIAYGDQQGFIRGAVITGMGLGTCAGLIAGANIGPIAALGGAAAGLALGGLMGKGFGIYAATT